MGRLVPRIPASGVHGSFSAFAQNAAVLTLVAVLLNVFFHRLGTRSHAAAALKSS